MSFNYKIILQTYKTFSACKPKKLLINNVKSNTQKILHKFITNMKHLSNTNKNYFTEDTKEKSSMYGIFIKSIPQPNTSKKFLHSSFHTHHTLDFKFVNDVNTRYVFFFSTFLVKSFSSFFTHKCTYIPRCFKN